LDGSHIYLTFLKEINPKLMTNMYKWGTLGLILIIVAENKLEINILHISDMVSGLSKFFINLMSF